MNDKRKGPNSSELDKLVEFYFPEGLGSQSLELDFLIDLVNYFRPINPKTEQVSIEILLQFLVDNPKEKQIIIHYVHQIFLNRRFYRMLSDAGILKDSNFFSEVRKRLFDKLLPEQPEGVTLQFVLNQVFYKDTDAIWINKIPNQELKRLFTLLEFKDIFVSSDLMSPLSQLSNTMALLCQRMSGRSLENDVIKMVPEYDAYHSPFAAMEKEFLKISGIVKKSELHSIKSDNLHYKHFLLLHKQCEEFVERAFNNSSKFGISLNVNQSLLRIRQQLYRLKILISLLIVNNEEDKIENSIQLGLKLIKYNCYKNNVGKLINESTQLLAYEITQHTAKTGEQYITESTREYFSMLWAAMGGGFIVGILCVIKLLFSKIDTSAFGHAFLYSMNYSIGFIIIYLLGFTLATKQPAMTAATISKSLEMGMRKQIANEEKHSSFAELFSRLFRSQFIAFVGNVLVSFPVSLLGVWLIDLIFGLNVAESRANKLICDLNPIHSAAIFHAAIAGFFLFLSGIISGSISNRNKHNQVYYRIQEHPVLKKSFGKAKTAELAKWFENKWAGVVSNGWFGCFLGSTASVGIFLGLNLDIRHITFSSGNFALGLYGSHFHVDFWTLFWSILGIGLIGFVNFIVSFSLSLGLAFRSRNIPVGEYKLLNKAIWAYFKRKPHAFFFPVKPSRLIPIR